MNELNDWMRRAEAEQTGVRAAFLEAINRGASPERARQMAEQAAAEARSQAGQAVVAGKIDCEAHFRSFTSRAAVHRVRDEFRRCRRLHQLDEAAPVPSPVSAEDSPESRAALLRDALRQLDRPARVLVRLHHFDGFTYQELADIHGVSATTMYRRLVRIRARLGQALVSLGISV